MQQQVAKEVKGFVVENFMFGEGADTLTADKSFLESGIIDSTGVLELVSFLEDKYKIKVKDEELVPDNLDSIVKIAEFVTRKKAA